MTVHTAVAAHRGPRRHRSWRTACAVLATLATLATAGAVALTASPAQADSWPWIGENGVQAPEPDRGQHSWCYHPDYFPEPAVVERIRWSMNRLQGQTQVDTAFHTHCRQHTDVRWMQRRIAEANVYGTTRCIVENSRGYCDRWQVRIDQAEIRSDAAHPAYEIRHTVCHELGHTVGLEHYRRSPSGGSHDCMRSGIWDSGALWTRSYSVHHRRHVNNWF